MTSALRMALKKSEANKGDLDLSVSLKARILIIESFISSKIPIFYNIASEELHDSICDYKRGNSKMDEHFSINVRGIGRRIEEEMENITYYNRYPNNWGLLPTRPGTKVGKSNFLWGVALGSVRLLVKKDSSDLLNPESITDDDFLNSIIDWTSMKFDYQKKILRDQNKSEKYIYHKLNDVTFDKEVVENWLVNNLQISKFSDSLAIKALQL